MVLGWLVSVAAPPLCWSCGASSRPDEPLCWPCRRRLRWLEPACVSVSGVPAWAPVAYEGPARDLVHALKFRRAAGVAEALAAQVVAAAPTGLLESARLVPVPLHRARLRRRGFNQAERLAQAIASRTGLPCSTCLERLGESSSQVGRSRAARLAAPREAVSVVTGLDAPASVLLVDDVITTGGTLAGCAAALRAAGAHEVAALAYARTLGR